MRVHYLLDDSETPLSCQTGENGLNVGDLQYAIKYHPEAPQNQCRPYEISVYPLGTTKDNYQSATPLKPEQPLPPGSAKKTLYCRLPTNPAPQPQPRSGKWVNPPCPLSNEEQIKVPKFMCYYKLGDTTPYYIETQGWEKTIGRLKERILETRGKRGTAQDLWGITEIEMYKIYPPGRNNETGDPLYPELDDYDMLIPTHSTFENPIIVPAVKNISAEMEQAKSIEEQVRQRMAAKKKRQQQQKSGNKENNKPATITVQVKTPDGNMIPVTLDPSNKIQSIKEQIAPQCGVNVADQILNFNGKELANDDSAKDSGLKDGSVIDLQPNKITVQVKIPDGKTIAVTMDPTNNIQSIKQNIAAKCGVDVPEQVLKFGDKELSNPDSAKESGLQDGSVIDLAPNKILVQVKTPDGKTIPVTMDPTDSIESIKQNIAAECGVDVPEQVLKFMDKELANPDSAKDSGLKEGSVIDLQPNTITVQVKTPDGKTIPVTLKPTDNIQSLKESLAPQCGVEVPQQVLVHAGKELSNNSDTATDAGLKDGSVIDLAPNTITVQVKTSDGKTIPVMLKPSDNIQAIKENIAQETGMEPNEQVLKFLDKVLPNDKSAKDAGLEDGSVIDLQPNTITVQVKTPDGKTIPVTIKPTDNIESIKEKIAVDCGVDVPEQVLKHMGKELYNADSAKDSGLKDGSVIDLAPNTITVQVKTPDGKTIPVTMNPNNNIQSIKENISPKCGVAVPEQVLNFQGKELPNDDSAKSSGLVDGSVIDLAPPKQIQVHVKTPDGTTISVTMDPTNSIQTIKESVAPAAGIDVVDQVLKFQDKELVNSDSAKDSGLVDGSVIDLVPPATSKDPNSITIQVRTPDGETIPVPIKLTDDIKSIKEQLAPKCGFKVPQQVLKFNDNELPNDDTAADLGLVDGSVLDLEPNKALARQLAKEKEKAEKKKKKKDKKDKKGRDYEDNPNQYGHEFNPTPLDLTRFKTHFMVGDQVPMELIIPSATTVYGFKEEILKLKDTTSFVKRYFAGLTDPDKLDVFPAGSYGEGEPLADELPVPRDSSPYKMFIVFRRK